MKFTEEEYQTIEDMAGLNYLPSEIAVYLDVPKKDFVTVYNNKESLVRYHYDRGKLVATMEVNQKLLENAKAGNITAAQIYQKESKSIAAQNIRNKILFGE